MTKPATKTTEKKELTSLARLGATLRTISLRKAIRGGTATELPNGDRVNISAQDWCTSAAGSMVLSVRDDFDFDYDCKTGAWIVTSHADGEQVCAFSPIVASDKQIARVEESFAIYGGVSAEETARRERAVLEAKIATQVALFVTLGISQKLALDMVNKIEDELLNK